LESDDAFSLKAFCAYGLDAFILTPFGSRCYQKQAVVTFLYLGLPGRSCWPDPLE
jgi:hypothetical protein